MLAIGCIQAQRCHTGHCPTGVATQNRWLMRGLDPTLKSARLANFLTMLRKEMTELSRSCGEPHPALIDADHFEILDDRFTSDSARAIFHYERGWGLPSEQDRHTIRAIMDGPLKPAA
jgi:glutamate synthase (ferredoxin)